MLRFLVVIIPFVLARLAAAQPEHKTKDIDPEAYMRSRQAFETGKQAHGNSYEFGLYAEWGESGKFVYWSKTTMKVENGVVTERRFETGQIDKPQKKGRIWKETGDKIGKSAWGIAPITIDQIYENGKKWLADQVQSPQNLDDMPDYMLDSYYFSTDDNGIITLMGMVPGGCMDDCFEGYQIQDFKWLK